MFRDGKSVGAGLVKDATPGKLITLMVGRSVDTVFPKVTVPLGDVVLSG